MGRYYSSLEQNLVGKIKSAKPMVIPGIGFAGYGNIVAITDSVKGHIQEIEDWVQENHGRNFAFEDREAVVEEVVTAKLIDVIAHEATHLDTVGPILEGRINLFPRIRKLFGKNTIPEKLTLELERAADIGMENTDTWPVVVYMNEFEGDPILLQMKTPKALRIEIGMVDKGPGASS